MNGSSAHTVWIQLAMDDGVAVQIWAEGGCVLLMFRTPILKFPGLGVWCVTWFVFPLAGCHDKAVLLYEYIGKRVVDLQHTEVPDTYRGRGIAKHLAKVWISWLPFPTGMLGAFNGFSAFPLILSCLVPSTLAKIHLACRECKGFVGEYFGQFLKSTSSCFFFIFF